MLQYATHRNANQKMTKSTSIYVNSALNDLIGSNIQEKEQWLEHVKSQVIKGVEYSELQSLLDLGTKMKIDIPDFVLQEIQNSFLGAAILQMRHQTFLHHVFQGKAVNSARNGCAGVCGK